MGRTLKELNVKIGGDINGFKRAMGRVERRMNRMSRNMSKIGDSITRNFGAPFIGLVAGSLHLFDKQAQAIAQVEAGIKSTGGTAGFTSEQLQKMASDLQGLTKFGDEDILSGVTSQLLTFTNVAGEQFKEAQVQALNLSTRLGVDLKSSTIQLGKALNDPIKGISAMSRSGIQFSEDQKAMIKSLVETGKTAEAQTIILKELENQFGGSAEAAAKAGLGPIKQLKNSIFDIGETIGEIALPMVAEMAEKLKFWADKIANLDDKTKKNILTVGKWITIIGGGLAVGGRMFKMVSTLTTAVKFLGVGVIKFKGIFKALNLVMRANPIGAVITGISLLIGAIVLGYKKSAKFRAILDGLASMAVEFLKILKESIGKFVGAFKAFGEGEWKQGLKLFGQGLVESNPVTVALTQGRRLGDSFLDGVKESLEESYKSEVEDTIKAVDIEVPPVKVPVKFVPEDGPDPSISSSSSKQVAQSLPSNNRNFGFGVGGGPWLREEAITPLIKNITKVQKALKDSSGFMTFSANVDNMTEKTLARIKKIQDAIEEFKTTVQNGLENTAAAMGENIGKMVGDLATGVASSSSIVAQITSPLISVMELVGKAAIKLGVTMLAAQKAIKFTNNPYVAIAAGVALVAASQAFRNSIPKLAEGGLAFGPTLAVVGDNPGARSGNPEVIAPLNKLKSMINPAVSLSEIKVTGQLIGQGPQLLGVIEYAQIDQNRYS